MPAAGDRRALARPGTAAGDLTHPGLSSRSGRAVVSAMWTMLRGERTH